ncbi:hypothetical protein [Amycolatopsis sp. CA-128772]|uniref:hypothetical protein n=1 Tax=Amycolatopsis sp. CA-128772 TaxID=2073159 RepID=UPI000CCFE5C4|nr:hypothetical protein [Amycolatopsis sp. CA-128772]
MGLFSSGSSATRERKAERERQEAEATAAIAAHEIGHAIGMAAAGIRVHWVRLTATGGQARGDDIDPEDIAAVDGYLVMTLAGWAAAAEWVHRHHGFSRSAALAWAKNGSRGDWADVRAKARYGSHTVRWYEREAQKLIRANWRRIERYTRELCRKGELPGSRFN